MLKQLYLSKNCRIITAIKSDWQLGIRQAILKSSDESLKIKTKHYLVSGLTIKTNNYGKELRRKIRFYLFSI